MEANSRSGDLRLPTHFTTDYPAHFTPYFEFDESRNLAFYSSEKAGKKGGGGTGSAASAPRSPAHPPPNEGREPPYSALLVVLSPHVLIVGRLIATAVIPANATTTAVASEGASL